MAKKGWSGQTKRHSNAKKYGVAGGKYALDKPKKSRFKTTSMYELASIGFAQRIYGEDKTDTQLRNEIKKEAKLMSEAGWKAKSDEKQDSENLNAPLSKQATKLPIQFSINVPSTNYDKKISSEAFRKRAENTAKTLSDKFGGDTAIKGKGDYTSEGKLIREDVVVIESSMTKADYEKKKPELEKFIKQKKKEWNQESIGYGFEDDFYIYPKF